MYMYAYLFDKIYVSYYILNNNNILFTTQTPTPLLYYIHIYIYYCGRLLDCMTCNENYNNTIIYNDITTYNTS